MKQLAKIIAFADWLGQQDETLVACYEKRLILWGCIVITRTVKTVNIEISLSEDEARWLLGYLQNSPQGLDESASDHYTRCDMFETLKEALIVEPPQAPIPPPTK